MFKSIEKLIQKIKSEFGLLLSISFGIFLFILFFQPFSFSKLDSNNSLLLNTGLGVIVFMIMVIVRIIIPWSFGTDDEETGESVFPSYFISFIIVILNSVSFAFFINFVGYVEITFYIMFKIVVICIIPPVVIELYDSFHKLKLQNESLIAEKKIIQKKVEQFESDILDKTIEFVSENATENFSLAIAEIVFIKSADNYVEIVYKIEDNFRKKLIRNTLRNIELQIKPYSIFLRCHRVCIVNVNFIEKLHREAGSNWLTIKGSDVQLPVSRQYLLKIQEIL